MPCKKWADCSCAAGGKECACGASCTCGSIPVAELEAFKTSQCDRMNCNCCEGDEGCSCCTGCNCTGTDKRTAESWIAMYKSKRASASGDAPCMRDCSCKASNGSCSCGASCACP